MSKPPGEKLQALFARTNRGMKLEALPFRMNGPGGPLRIAGGAGQ